MIKRVSFKLTVLSVYAKVNINNLMDIDSLSGKNTQSHQKKRRLFSYSSLSTLGMPLKHAVFNKTIFHGVIPTQQR